MGDKLVYKYFKEDKEYDETVFKPVNLINKSVTLKLWKQCTKLRTGHFFNVTTFQLYFIKPECAFNEWKYRTQLLRLITAGPCLDPYLTQCSHKITWMDQGFIKIRHTFIVSVTNQIGNSSNGCNFFRLPKNWMALYFF